MAFNAIGNADRLAGFIDRSPEAIDEAPQRAVRAFPQGDTGGGLDPAPQRRVAVAPFVVAGKALGRHLVLGVGLADGPILRHPATLGVGVPDVAGRVLPDVTTIRTGYPTPRRAFEALRCPAGQIGEIGNHNVVSRVGQELSPTSIGGRPDPCVAVLLDPYPSGVEV
ncbi:MAG: hypothetical protein EBZ17_02830 [Actinobacteria bacterium]|nr:hypothetical protein [Actinomycetota bacterium]